MPRCVVPGCHRRDTSTHYFPRDPVRRLQWIVFVKSLDPEFSNPGQYSSICGAHFETQCYNFNFWIDKEENSFGCKHPRRTLSDEAVPTIVGDEIAFCPPNSDQSTQEISDMVKSQPLDGSVTETVTATTTVRRRSARSSVAGTVENDSGGRNYSVVRNQSRKKVCIFRPLAQKNTATSSPPVVSLSITTTKAETLTTSSSQTTSTVVRIGTSSSTDGAQTARVMKTYNLPKNLKVNGKQTIIKKLPVVGNLLVPKSKSSAVQTPKPTSQAPRCTIHYQSSTKKANALATKKLFTVDELEKLSKVDFINKFTSKVQIKDSTNFAMRCQLIKNCPFIISCPSERDCRDVMFLHLRKHISTLRSRQGENQIPYKISTGVRLGATQIETLTQDSVNIICNGPSEAASSAAKQRALQNDVVISKSKSTPLNLKPSSMKIFPVSKVQVNSPIQTTTPSTSTCKVQINRSGPNGIVTKIQSTPTYKTVTSSAPLLLDPQNLPVKNAGNGQQMMFHIGKQLRVVQSPVSGAGTATSSNMTFILVPYTKPVTGDKGAGASSAVSGPTTSTQQAHFSTGTSTVRTHSGTTTSILQNKTGLTTRIFKTHSVQKASTGINLHKVIQPPFIQNRTYIHKGSVVPTPSLKPNASAVEITNEMILKAKAVLDMKANKSGTYSPLAIKVTPPRLYDLAKHAVMNSDAWNFKLARFLSHVHKRKPLSKSAIRLKIFPRNQINPGTGNSSFGAYMARKNEFLSTQLHLERVGSKKMTERCKQRDTRTRLQRQKFRRQLMNKSADPSKAQHFNFSNHKDLHSRVFKDGLVRKKRSRKSVLWWKEPEPKRIKFEFANRKQEVKFRKSTKKAPSFWYATRENFKKPPKKVELDKPLKDLLQPGLVVLKRNATSLPQREIESTESKKTKPCEEVTIGGKVIKIKQEPMSDEELISDPIDIDDVPDRMLQPPSDDDMDDLFPDDNTASDIETTDSESEYYIEKKRAQVADSPVITSVTSKLNSEAMEDEVDVPLLAIKYFQRLCEIIRVTRSQSSTAPVVLPATLKKCKICSVEFERVDMLLHHYKMHAIQNIQSNDHVEESLPSTSTKRQHPASHRHGSDKNNSSVCQYEKPFKCELCENRFYTCKGFEEHLIERHSHSTKAMTHVLFSQPKHSSRGSDSSIFDLVLPDLNTPKEPKDTPTTSGNSLNNLLIENANQIALDSLECKSPPLPSSPQHGAICQQLGDSSLPHVRVQTIPTSSPESKEVEVESVTPPGIQPIKLTLFPTNGNGLSRICFSNNRKLLES